MKALMDVYHLPTARSPPCATATQTVATAPRWKESPSFRWWLCLCFLLLSQLGFSCDIEFRMTLSAGACVCCRRASKSSRYSASNRYTGHYEHVLRRFVKYQLLRHASVHDYLGICEITRFVYCSSALGKIASDVYCISAPLFSVSGKINCFI